jgi:hypothetical protein
MDFFNSYMILSTDLRSIIHYIVYKLVKYDIIRMLTKCRIAGCENRRNPDRHICSVHKSSELDIIIPRKTMIQMFKYLNWNLDEYYSDCFLVGYDICGLNPAAGFEITFVRSFQAIASDDRTLFDTLNKYYPGIELYILNLTEQKKILKEEITIH